MRVSSNNGVNHLSAPGLAPIPAPVSEKPDIRIGSSPVVSKALFSHLEGGQPGYPINLKALVGRHGLASLTALAAGEHAAVKTDVSPTHTPVVSQSVLRSSLRAGAGGAGKIGIDRLIPLQRTNLVEMFASIRTQNGVSGAGLTLRNQAPVSNSLGKTETEQEN